MNTAFRANFLLLVSASERRIELQRALEERLNLNVSSVGTFSEAISAVGSSAYSALVLDEALSDLDPGGANLLLTRCKDELAIFVKLSISGVCRCVKQIEVAIKRFEREQQAAFSSVQRDICFGVRDALTALTISAQLALNIPGLPSDAAKQLEAILEAGRTIDKTISSLR